MINLQEPRYVQALQKAEAVTNLSYLEPEEKTAAMDDLLDFINTNWPAIDAQNPQNVADYKRVLTGESKDILNGLVDVHETVWTVALIVFHLKGGLLHGVTPRKMKSFKEWQTRIAPLMGLGPHTEQKPKKYLKKYMEKQ